MGLEPGKAKWLAKGNLEEMPLISDLNYYECATLSESACVSLHTYLYFFPPNKHFTYFTTFRLCGNSFLQSQRARALSLTTGLVARIRCLTSVTRPQSLTGNQNLASSHCRPRPPEVSSIPLSLTVSSINLVRIM